eukprot:TRINITY_DN39071_c0_g1_i1.p1 TRINITY_DN39071_c0_g1~~TRINITY_DN39071_c0_g1_i1.p1  ORF type:complete len:309 (+),score=43.81 TRINITY_DN39071_c0_g1_i1:88-927(+)
MEHADTCDWKWVWEWERSLWCNAHTSICDEVSCGSAMRHLLWQGISGPDDVVFHSPLHRMRLHKNTSRCMAEGSSAVASSFASLVDALKCQEYFLHCGTYDCPYPWDPQGVKKGHFAALRALLEYTLFYHDTRVAAWSRNTAGVAPMARDEELMRRIDTALDRHKLDRGEDSQGCIRPVLSSLLDDSVLPHDKIDLVVTVLDEVRQVSLTLPGDTDNASTSMMRRGVSAAYGAARRAAGPKRLSHLPVQGPGPVLVSGQVPLRMSPEIYTAPVALLEGC